MTRTQKKLLLAVTITQSFAVGLSFGIFPVFLQPLERAFEASRTQVSAGQVLLMLAMSVGGIGVGHLLDKGRPRRIMLGGACIMILGFAWAAISQQLWMLGLTAFALGLCLPAIGPLVSAGLVSRSFDASRGRALGIMSVGPPLGSGVFAALAGYLLPSLGWAASCAVFAALAALVLLPLIVWAIPAELDASLPVKPADDTAAPAVGQPAAVSLPDDGAGLGAILALPVFFWTLLAYAMTMGVHTAWTVHVAAFLGTLGLDTAGQATVLAASFWMGIPGAIFFGMVADKLPAERLFGVLIGGGALVLWVFSQHPAVEVVIFLAAFNGFLTGGSVPLYTMLLGKRVGTTHFGKAMGVSNLFVLPIMAVSVLLAANRFERDGHYSSALFWLVLVLMAALACLLRSNYAARRQRPDPIV